MNRNFSVAIAILSMLLFFVFGCSESKSVGTVCLGDNLDTLFESLPAEAMKKVKKGDIIATKNPGLWLDFNYPVAYNNYNSAIGKYAGFDRTIMTNEGKEITLEDFFKKIRDTESEQK